MKTLVLFISLCVLYAAAYTQTLPTGFMSTNAVPGVTWDQPVGAVFSKLGNQLFVWEKGGLVYVCNRNADGDYIRQTDPVLDISEEVGNYADYGLLGFALDPQFESNGYIYASYVVDRHHLLYFGTPDYNPATTLTNVATIGRITRYKTSTSGDIVSAIPGNRTVLLGETKKDGLPILYQSHGMGSLAFAADGTLLASMGDGASFTGVDVGPGSDSYYAQALADSIIRADENVGAWRSQMLTSLNGKLLRIDPSTGAGISSNPFYEASASFSTKSKIWALGLRNPFRFSIKPGQGSTNPSDGHIGEVFVGDVGLGVWEELNVVKEKGMNFGWPWYEGHNFQPYLGDNTYNMEVPIPAAYPCGIRQYAKFWELIRQDNEAGDRRVYYPCYDPSESLTPVVMGNARHNIHARPVLDWLQAEVGIGPNARVGIFSVNGADSIASIGTAGSGVTGALFNGNASTGGIWYTGSSFPPEYTNTFLLADYGEKWIKKITFDITNKVTRVDAFANNIGSVVCMAENPVDGSVVYVDVVGGMVNKITFGGNMPPVAKIIADTSYSPDPSLTVHFDGTGSYDPDGTPVTNINYAWDFGDPESSDNLSSLPAPTHLFTTISGVPKKYIVKLTVTDIAGKSTIEQFIVSVNNTPPVVDITSPIDGYKYRVGGDTTFLLTASVTDAQHQPAELSYEWQTILIHNNHTHAEPTDNNPSTSAVINQIGCSGVDYHYLIRLKVSDGAGLFTIDSSQIYPNCSGPLPIFLHKFSVTQSGAVNLVKWTTELESNIEYFEVERSSNGINFSTIHRQEASNATGPNHYSFADNQSLPGFNYYRLKIVERGSVIRYSVVVRTVVEGEENTLKVIPNPVVNNFSLSYMAREKDRVIIQIRDIAGRLLQTFKEDVNKGQNVIYMQNLPNWNSGVYYISVQNKDEVKQAKFIKAR